MRQATNEVLMIRPKSFGFNVETAKNNLYQNRMDLKDEIVQEKALKEFDAFVESLRAKGIKVDVLEDTRQPHTPDSIFPNNWFSTHDGKLLIYPMYAENRKLEVGKFLDDLVELYNPDVIIDLREKFDGVIESTGALVLDRVNKKAYCSLSQRADIELFEYFCKTLGYRPISFESYQMGQKIYHTNVMMSIASRLAFVATELIDESMRDEVLSELREDHEIVELTGDQILKFCANVLEVRGKDKSYLVMSKTAYAGFLDSQIELIEQYMEIIAVDIDTIETIGGGSARCMLAEIF